MADGGNLMVEADSKVPAKPAATTLGSVLNLRDARRQGVRFQSVELGHKGQGCGPT